MNPIEGTGPGREGLKEITGFFTVIFSDVKFQRMITLVCGDMVVVISKFDGERILFLFVLIHLIFTSYAKHQPL